MMGRWKRDWKLMSVFFSGDEIVTITERLKNLKIENVVFCSFESRFARSGGLASVTENILPYLKEVNNIPSVILMTPFYPHIISTSKVKSTGIHFKVPFMNKTVRAELLEYTRHYNRPVKGSLKEYYIRADGFFETALKIKDPYVYDESDPEKNNSEITRNALFYCKSVPYALNALGIKENIVFHLNEWQTTLITLTSKEAMLNNILKSCGCIQTLHNSYDSHIPWMDIVRLLERPRRKKIRGFSNSSFSALEIGLQLIDAPVTTVSENFAKELSKDVIQTEYYAPHLQKIFKNNPLIGINNGMFVDFSPEYPERGNHLPDQIRSIKLKKRQELLEMLESYRPSVRFGELTYRGRSITELPDEVPIFIMSGRLDPVQKGYYVFLRAIERFSIDEIKVILIPLPSRREDLDYFYEVACKCRGNVTVFPMRISEGYNEFQTGATFGVMPSIYEPFGAAVEYMANGTVVIARATGGLVNQVDESCGFLFFEDQSLRTPENIKSYIDTSDIVQLRKKNPWAESMAESLYRTMKRAIGVYKNKPERYYQLIINGFKKAGRFTWDESAKKYFEVYNMITQ